jgi:16S rRNA (guanine527-N7)-methyltransferase
LNYKSNIEQQDLLNQFLKEHGVQLPEETLDKLYQFADLVVETKQFGNLISAKDSEKFLSRHIADSLIPYIYIRRETRDERRENVPESLSSLLFEPRLVGSDMNVQAPPQHSPLSSFVCSEPASVLSSIKWADMGAGAGCPVFPLAIAMPEVQFYAVEPRHMRVEFMNYAKEKLGLKNLTVVGKRFETSGLTDLDFISCRALSTFENDWERAQPALKKGGLFLTLKSFNSISHLENDPVVSIWKYKLPNEEQDYALVTRGNND